MLKRKNKFNKGAAERFQVICQFQPRQFLQLVYIISIFKLAFPLLNVSAWEIFSPFEEFRWWSKSGLGASRCWHLFPHLAASKLLAVLIRWHPDWHIWLTPGGSRSGAQVDFWYIKNQTQGFMYICTPGHILASMIIHQHHFRSNMLNCWPLQSEEVCLPVV